MDWQGTLTDIWEVVNTRLFSIADTPVSVATVITVCAIVGLTFLGSHLLQRAVRRAFKFRVVHRDGTARAVSRLVHYLALMVGLGTALQTMGIDLGALFAAGAIFAVGLGFAMQSIAQNFVAGVILLVERSIKPGDILGVEGNIVKVVDLGIRATIVETRDGENLIVPNSVLIQSTVKNYTLKDSAFRVRVSVGVSYSSDVADVRAALTEVGTAIHDRWATSGHEPSVVVAGFGDNSVNFEVAVWMDDPWHLRAALSELNEAVWWSFQERGIVIAFPQLDVHFDDEAVSTLQSSPARRDA